MRENQGKVYHKDRNFKSDYQSKFLIKNFNRHEKI